MYKLAFLLIVVVLAFSNCTEEIADKPAIKKPLLAAKIVTPKNNTFFALDKDVKFQMSFDTTKVVKVELLLKDKVLLSQDNPKANSVFTVKAGELLLGSNTVTMVATLKDATQKRDTRIVKILSSVEPELKEALVVKEYPHKLSSYTQGLEFYAGELYEGTGQYGSSVLAKVNLETGEFINSRSVSAQYFGEGITILNSKLYQLTWKAKKCLVYDVNSLTKVLEFNYLTEGWGLTNDGTQLIMSDGTEKITFRDPETFEINKTIEVYTNRGPLTNLNELEYINGKIYANIYTTNQIAVINPENGTVETIIDASIIALDYRKSGEVLNGIAFNKKNNKLYLTGKNWPSLLEVKID